MIDRWREWIAAFNQATQSDRWDTLREFLDPEVTYTVSGAPFACSLSGVDAVLAGFAKSIANFDRKFDERGWFGIGVREFAPDTITGRAMGVYRLGDNPLLYFTARSLWRFKEHRIIQMNDMYDLAEADVQAALQWLSQVAPDLDASYE